MQTPSFSLSRLTLWMLAVLFLSFAMPENATALETPGGMLPPMEENVGNENEGSDSSGTMIFFKAIGSLALVLGLVVLAGWVLKRYAQIPGVTSGRSETIKIVATKMLGGRRSLMLIRVRGQTLLLGVTPQAINCLTEIHEVEGDWAQPSDDEGNPQAPQSIFDKHLGRYVNQTIDDSNPNSNL